MKRFAGLQVTEPRNDSKGYIRNRYMVSKTRPEERRHVRYRGVPADGGIQRTTLTHICFGLCPKIRMKMNQRDIRASQRRWHQKHPVLSPVGVLPRKRGFQPRLSGHDVRRKPGSDQPRVLVFV